MPHYNIWIREEDDKNWLAIENRSEWLHERLQGLTEKELDKHFSEAKKYGSENIEEIIMFSSKLCKHGSIKGECMHKEATRLKCNVI